MFCTTECWNCEDKNCEHYINKQELYFENQQLKKNCNIGNENLNFYKEEYQKYKSVLDEIREYIINDIQHCNFGQAQKYQDILQILDKVKYL